MKKFLAIVILIFTFQTPSQADDIRDFQIEGMSIGDSLLDYFSEEEINNGKEYRKQAGENKKYAIFNLSNVKNYDKANVAFKDSDSKFKIAVVSGYIWFDNDIKGCLKKKEEILSEIKSLFSNLKIQDDGKSKHEFDNKSFTYNTYFLFPGEFPQDHIAVSCYDWSEDSEHTDHLRIGIVTSEYMKWLYEVADKTL